MDDSKPTWQVVEEWLQQGSDRTDSEPPLTLEFLPADFLRRHPPEPRPVAIVGVLCVGDMAIISGGWDTFKSTFALELVHSLTSGEHFLGRYHVSRTLRMGLLQTEVDPGHYVERLNRVGACANLHICSDFTFSFERLPELARVIEYNNLDGMVLDPIGQMWPARAVNGEPFSENNKTHVEPLLKALRLLDKTIILVHHDPKAGQGTRNRASGSSALLNDPDVRILLDRQDPLLGVEVRNRLQRPAGRFDVKFEGGRLKTVK